MLTAMLQSAITIVSESIPLLRPGSPQPLACVLLCSTSCVRKETYDAAVADANSIRAQLAASTDKRRRPGEDSWARSSAQDAQAALQQATEKLSDVSTADHNVQAELDQSTAINGESSR